MTGRGRLGDVFSLARTGIEVEVVICDARWKRLPNHQAARESDLTWFFLSRDGGI